MTDLTASDSPPIPQPRDYEARKRKWTDYNKAKMREARDLRELLQKACRTIPEELRFQQPIGRPRMGIEEAAFACVLKVYHLWSGRRSTFFFQDAADRGLLSRNWHWNSIGNYFRDPRMTDVFQYLIASTARPLIPHEDDGRVTFDATYIPGGSLLEENEKMFGGYEDSHRPVKLNIASGVRTHVVMACIIEGPTAHESQFLPGLLVTAIETGYKITKVYADKAYLSAAHYELVKKLGIEGYIPFRVSDKGIKGGELGAFHEIYEKVMATRETQAAFKAEYVLRNNVEAAISMFKRQQGKVLFNRGRKLLDPESNSLKRDDVSMVNEALCKLIAHNIGCVVRYVYEAGLAPDFLKHARRAPAVVPGKGRSEPPEPAYS